jgi:hypothetical protein
MTSRKKHWDKIFSCTEDSKLGWFEKDTSRTFELLHHIPDWEKGTVFLPGAGTTVLIDDLLSKGVRLVLNDISSEALDSVRLRLKDESGKLIGYARIFRNLSRELRQRLTYGLTGLFCTF